MVEFGILILFGGRLAYRRKHIFRYFFIGSIDDCRAHETPPGAITGSDSFPRRVASRSTAEAATCMSAAFWSPAISLVFLTRSVQEAVPLPARLLSNSVRTAPNTGA